MKFSSYYPVRTFYSSDMGLYLHQKISEYIKHKKHETLSKLYFSCTSFGICLLLSAVDDEIVAVSLDLHKA